MIVRQFASGKNGASLRPFPVTWRTVSKKFCEEICECFAIFLPQ
jgi:hypothetical protein